MNNIDEQKNKEELALIIFYDVLSKIKNGVDNGKGGIRPYDILDYYQNEGIEMSRINELIYGKVTLEELNALRAFLKSNSRGADINEYHKRDLLNVKETRLLKDKDGKPIPGTAREITKEDKEKAFAYIEAHNLPMTSKIYSIIIDRYINGELDLSETKENVPKV